MSAYFHQVYEPAERSAVQMNPVTSQRQGGVVKSSESTLEWMVKSRNDVSNSSMGLFIIAVLANNFFQFGTNYLALFLFIILTSNLSIYDKVSRECERIAADNTKLTDEIKKLANDVCALLAEKNKFASEVEALRRDKANSSSNNLVRLEGSSPRNVDVVLPCLKQPLSLFHANAEEEEENDKDAHENDADQYDNDVDSQSDGYESAEGQDVCDWKDFEPDEFLTFYVGNLHYNANCYQVKKAIQEAICLKTVPIVDQVVIAKTSKGESQGCAFVTVRWDSYMSIDYYSRVEIGDEIPDDPHAYNEFLQDRFCSKAGRARICGRRVFVEVARSQRRN